MKIFIKLLSLFVLILTLFNFTACIGPGITDYNETMFGKYTFHKTSPAQQFINDGGSNIFEGVIYKYTYDKTETYIIAHLWKLAEGYGSKDALYKRLFNGREYNVLYDKMVVYNTKDKTSAEFETYDDFLDYCSKNNLTLNNWRYPSSGLSIDSEESEIADSYTLSKLPYDYSLISYNDKEFIRGYITDVKVTAQQIKLRLRQTDYDYDAEYPEEVNIGLSELSDEPVGKYRRGFLDYTNVYYDKDITIDIATGKITETEH